MRRRALAESLRVKRRSVSRVGSMQVAAEVASPPSAISSEAAPTVPVTPWGSLPSTRAAPDRAQPARSPSKSPPGASA